MSTKPRRNALSNACPPAARSISSKMKRTAPSTKPVRSDVIAPWALSRGQRIPKIKQAAIGGLM